MPERIQKKEARKMIRDYFHNEFCGAENQGDRWGGEFFHREKYWRKHGFAGKDYKYKVESMNPQGTTWAGYKIDRYGERTEVKRMTVKKLKEDMNLQIIFWRNHYAVRRQEEEYRRQFEDTHNQLQQFIREEQVRIGVREPEDPPPLYAEDLPPAYEE
jgi:hypothetical protein